MDRFQGKVVKKRIATGSKSEREAVVLETEGRDIVLRKKGANPFESGDMENLVGKTITAEGSMLGGYTLLLSNWAEL
jgi:hypothetical protein